MAFFANIFGYILNFIYGIVNNYGLAIIIFSIIIKLVSIPITIRQQENMEKSEKLQKKTRELQIKYSNNPEKLNQEMIDLYKTEKMNPFSGCFSTILQIVLMLSIFYIVQSPLTYMKKIDANVIETYKAELSEENKETAYPEIAIIREKGNEDSNVYINMNFLGLDLSSVPNKELSNWKNYIIPLLYILSTFISMKITTEMQKKRNKQNKQSEVIILNNEEKDENDMSKTMEQSNKMMTYMMPILTVSIAIIAPLGLALYWLTNNLLSIIERLMMNMLRTRKNTKEDL